MITHLLAVILLGISLCAAELPQGTTGTILELVARDGTRYTHVTVTRREQGRIAFRHDDGMTTLSLSAFDDNNLERLVPGHLASIKAKRAEADAKEQERERTRDTQRKQALEQDPKAAAQAKNEDDIREAAFRYAFTHFETRDFTKISAIIIVIEDDTPSDEFLKRFATHKPPVRKIPRFRRNEIQDTELSCYVYKIKWLSDTEAEIAVSRVIGEGEAAVSFRYTMRLTNKGWEVVQYKLTGIQ